MAKAAKAEEAEVVSDDATPKDDAEKTAESTVQVEPVNDVPDDDTDVDPDAAEIEAAREALKASDAGDGSEAEPEPQPDASQGQQTTTATPQDQPTDPAVQPTPKPAPEPGEGDQPETITVPKTRLDEVIAQRDKAAAQAAYFKGQADFAAQQRAQAGDGTQTPGEAQPTPEEQVTGLRNQIFEAAEQFDNGDITLAEFKKTESQLEDQIEGIRTAARTEPAPEPADPQVSPQSDLYLDQLTSQLEDAHPYLAQLELTGDPARDAVTEQHINTLAAYARAELTAENVQIPNDARGTFMIRERAAKLSDVYGPIWFPDANVTQQPTPQQPTPPGPDGDGKAALTPRQQQTLTKVQQAQNHPPDTSTVGAGETDTAEVAQSALSKIEAGQMSEDEMAALPDSVKAKIRGGAW